MCHISDPIALDLHRVTKLYGHSVALRAVDLSLQPGEVLALLGPNGSGKTTLLKIVAGAIKPTLGGGLIFGLDMATERAALRSIVGLLASESYLYDDLSALENLRFVATMAGRQPEAPQLREQLCAVGLEPHTDTRVRAFSSGMKRRLALARLALLQPRLWLLDEPYNSLDAEGAERVDDLLRQATAQGAAAILATHDADRALAIADRVVRLERGAVVYAGTAAAYRLRSVQHVG